VSGIDIYRQGITEGRILFHTGETKQSTHTQTPRFFKVVEKDCKWVLKGRKHQGHATHQSRVAAFSQETNLWEAFNSFGRIVGNKSSKSFH
jgi:hypothetical protein